MAEEADSTKRPLLPLPWWAAWSISTVAAFAYLLLLLRYDWPGHPVIAVVAVYFAVLSLLSNGWRRSE